MSIEQPELLLSSFDIETTPFSMFTPEIHLIGLYNDSISIFFDTAHQFVTYCFAKPQYKSYTHIIVAFNLQFDFNIIMDEYFSQTPTLPYKWQVKLLNVNGKQPRFAIYEQKLHVQYTNQRKRRKTRTYTQTIYFIDVANYFGGIRYKLEYLIKIYTPELLFGKQTGDFGLVRNEIDIIATLKIFKHFLELKEKNNRYQPLLSISSSSFLELKEVCNYHWMHEDKDQQVRLDWLVKLERKSYKGGIVYPNPKFIEQEIKNVAYYDINSLYPFIMRDLKVCVAFLSKEDFFVDVLKDIKIIVKKHVLDITKFRIYQVRFTCSYPILPVKKQGKLQLVTNESCLEWICENELYPVLQRKKNPFKELMILQVVTYQAEYQKFKPYIDKYTQLKTDCDKTIQIMDKIKTYRQLTDIEEQRLQKATIDRMYAKLKQNTAYGKFGQVKINSRLFTQEDKEFSFLQEHQPDYFTDDKAKLIYKMRYEQQVIYGENFDEQSESIQAVTVVASSITAGARGYIMKFYEPDTTVYIDTDSITTYTKDFEAKYSLSIALGGWKKEKEGTIITYGKKHYKFNDILKCKGIPSKAIQISEYEFHYYRLVGYREAKIRQLPAFSSLYIKKVLHPFEVEA